MTVGTGLFKMLQRLNDVKEKQPPVTRESATERRRPWMDCDEMKYMK